MAYLPRAIALATLVALIAFLTSCSLIRPKLSEDGLAKVSSPGPGTLYMKPGHPVGTYDSILLANKFGIHYALGQDPLPSGTEQALVNRMIAGLQQGVNAEFELALAPDPCTVQLGLYLTRVNLYESTGQGAQTSYVNSYGQATLVFEFRDSMTDEPLIRYGQTARLGSGVEGGSNGPDIDRLNRALDVMLRNVGRKLQEVVPVAQAVESENGCNGKIGKAVLAARDQAS